MPSLEARAGNSPESSLVVLKLRALGDKFKISSQGVLKDSNVDLSRPVLRAKRPWNLSRAWKQQQNLKYMDATYDGCFFDKFLS